MEPGESEDDLARSLRRALHDGRAREVEQGFTMTGPHRDDLQMALDGMDAGLYASRGQCRTIVLAMKLAEAAYLSERRGQEPILLLDDVLSELDAGRRSHVLDTAGRYQQCFITTTDLEPIDKSVSFPYVQIRRAGWEHRACLWIIAPALTMFAQMDRQCWAAARPQPAPL